MSTLEWWTVAKHSGRSYSATSTGRVGYIGKGDKGWHGENLSVETETNSYHSLIVEAHRVSAALCFGFGDVLPPRCPSRIQ